MTYTTPAGSKSRLYSTILQQPHTLIAGATGSGKSVLVNGLIYTALYSPPGEGPGGLSLILCDPKRVELSRYKRLPHVQAHAQTVPDILRALEAAAAVMEARFCDMDRRGLVETDKGHLYCIVDEYADLMLNCTKTQLKIVQHLAELGRAAHVHLILATQAPSRQVITAPIAVNMTCKVALRCDSAIESRQIIGERGAEALPTYGDALVKIPSHGVTHYTGIRMYTPEEIAAHITWWTSQHPRPFHFFHRPA
jgi:S-DNA-T family DNA segregation ATPase FtsK/SpoIIIE